MTQQVSIFLPSLEAGGAERSMATLAEGFAERGLQVDVVLANAVGPYLGTLSEKIKVVDLRANRVLLSLIPLIRYLRSRKPDSLITAMDHASLVALLAKRWSGEKPRVIVSVHKMMSQPRSLDTVGRREKMIHVLARRLYPDADQIVAVSRAAAVDLSSRLGLPDDRIHVIHNPVDTEKVKSMAGRGASHPWSGAIDPVILGVGRLSPEKDFATLIRAFSIIVRSRPSRLIIIGDGPERSRLQELIAESRVHDLVDLPGTQPNPYGFMSEAAVLALPSIWESFGRVLVEAMACGTSVVATRSQGGVAEILENGKYGRLVPVGDAEAMAQAIKDTLDAPESPETLRSRASDFNVERIVEEYLRLF